MHTMLQQSASTNCITKKETSLFHHNISVLQEIYINHDDDDDDD